MKRIVYVDMNAVLGEGRLFAAGAISALVTLAQRCDLVQVLPDETDRRLQVALEVLEGEGVVFNNVAERESLIRVPEESPAYTEGQHTSVFAVWKGSLTPMQGDRLVGINVDAVGWPEAVRRVLYPPRVGARVRRTSETEISVRVDLDGTGSSDITTGIGFFDHMLEQVSRHSGADLWISVSGDLHVDEHHTIEDTAIALGEAFGQAIGDKRGIERYAFVLPMDDSLARVAFDWSGRSWLVWDADFKREKIGDMPTEMFFHFFKSFSDAARCNLNVSVDGDNEHHMIESVFKAFGRCLRQASSRSGDDDRVPSTKGTL